MKKGFLILFSVAFLATGSVFAQAKSDKADKAKTECCQNKTTCPQKKETCKEKKNCKETTCPAQKTTPAKKACCKTGDKK